MTRRQLQNKSKSLFGVFWTLLRPFVTFLYTFTKIENFQEIDQRDPYIARTELGDALPNTQYDAETTSKQAKTIFWCMLDTFETIWDLFGHFYKNRKFSKN